MDYRDRNNVQNQKVEFDRPGERSPIQDFVHPDDQTQPFETTPGFKPFTMFKIFFAAKCCVGFYCPTQVRDRVDSGPSNFIQQNHKFGDKNLNLLISVYKN